MPAPATPPHDPTGPWLVVGLGNPGPQYAGNRHNIGAMAIEALARQTGTQLRQHKARAHVAELRLGTLPGGAPGPRVVAAVPMSYMNESGGPTKALLGFFSIPPERLIVLHDELDIDAGEVRLKRGGGEGGHNGLRSISSATGTRDYLRVRLGIGRPPGRMDAAAFVLKDFPASARTDVELLIGDGVDAVEALVHTGLEAAQQRFHAPR